LFQSSRFFPFFWCFFSSRGVTLIEVFMALNSPSLKEKETRLPGFPPPCSPYHPALPLEATCGFVSFRKRYPPLLGTFRDGCSIGSSFRIYSRFFQRRGFPCPPLKRPFALQKTFWSRARPSGQPAWCLLDQVWIVISFLAYSRAPSNPHPTGLIEAHADLYSFPVNSFGGLFQP